MSNHGNDAENQSSGLSLDIDNLEINNVNSELTQLGCGIINYITKLDNLNPVILAFFGDVVNTMEEEGSPVYIIRDVLKKFSMSTDAGKVSSLLNFS